MNSLSTWWWRDYDGGLYKRRGCYYSGVAILLVHGWCRNVCWDVSYDIKSYYGGWVIHICDTDNCIANNNVAYSLCATRKQHITVIVYRHSNFRSWIGLCLPSAASIAILLVLYIVPLAAINLPATMSLYVVPVSKSSSFSIYDFCFKAEASMYLCSMLTGSAMVAKRHMHRPSH